MQQSQTVYLAVSLDVEEEGLFCGRYQQKEVTVRNTQALSKLEPLFGQEIRPTLFCAHSVLSDASSTAILRRLYEEKGCEIAAHLHHWNTPPITLHDNGAPRTSVPSADLPPAEFAAKLSSVLELAEKVHGRPVTSFRMGRWDLHKEHWDILSSLGILTDASVRPLHGKRKGSKNPDHFDAPSSPYWIPTPHGTIFEVPLTVTPLIRPLARIVNCMARGPAFLAGFADFLKSTTNYWGALALLPAYHPLFAMEAITRLHIARGGRLLSLTWHSSEMQAGATPHLPTEKHVSGLLKKIESYIAWLRRNYHVVCLPMNELRNSLGRNAPTVTCSVGDYSLSEMKG